MRAGWRLLWGVGVAVALLLGGPLWMLATERNGDHWAVASREPGADTYRMHHVLSWRRPTLISQATADPDRTWFGNAPALLADYRGEAAERLIPAIEAAVAAYPATDRYRVWPGPNMPG